MPFNACNILHKPAFLRNADDLMKAKLTEAKKSRDPQNIAAVEAEIAVANHEKLVPELIMKIKKSLANLYSKDSDFEGLTLVVIGTKEIPPIAIVRPPADVKILGCDEKQLKKSGFPMQVFKHGFPLYNLLETQRDAFKMIDEQDLHAVTILLGEQGRLLFGR